MLPCNDCKYNKSGKVSDTKCLYCKDYCNHRPINNRKFVTIILIPYIILFIITIAWCVL
jgi:hypothetical protein